VRIRIVLTAAACAAVVTLLVAMPQVSHAQREANARGRAQREANARSHAQPSRTVERSPDVRAARDSRPLALAGRLSHRTFTDHGVAIHYTVFFPSGYDANKQWPVVVALHGSREKGEDGMKQVDVGVGKLVQLQSETFPAVVVLPQVPARGQIFGWVSPIMRLIDAAVHEVNGDPSRVYLTGLSFGGILAYNLAYDYPDRFAALIPVSAYVVLPDPQRDAKMPQAEANARVAQALRGTPMWIFHGERDTNIPVAQARELVATLKAAGVPVRYTEIRDMPHESWDQAYRTPELWGWVLAQHR